jgi:hypothetical protein
VHSDDDDFDMDFVFDLESLELFETTPATPPRPAPLEARLARLREENARGGRLLRAGEAWLAPEA